MSTFVLFVNSEGFLRLLSVAPGRDRMIVAAQVAPEGNPFWLVDYEEIPNDDGNYDAWKVDLSEVREPDGYGEADV